MTDASLSSIVLAGREAMIPNGFRDYYLQHNRKHELHVRISFPFPPSVKKVIWKWIQVDSGTSWGALILENLQSYRLRDCWQIYPSFPQKRDLIFTIMFSREKMSLSLLCINVNKFSPESLCLSCQGHMKNILEKILMEQMGC